ncbi:MAG: methyl-accepting chemotaxis protein [Candidatus Polarisedimenticolia bacterium]
MTNTPGDTTVPARRWPAGGVRWRLTGAAGGLLALSSAVLVAAGAGELERRSFETMRLRGASLARLLASTAAVAIEEGGQERLRELLQSVTWDGSLAYLEVADRGGSVVAEAGAGDQRPIYAVQGAGTVPLGPAGREDRVIGLYGDPLYVFRFPIRGRSERPEPGLVAGSGTPGTGAPSLGPRTAVAAPRPGGIAGLILGEVRVAFSAAAVDAPRDGFLFRGALLGLVLTLGGVLVTHVATRRVIGDPAGRLAAVAVRLERGDLTARARPAGAPVAATGELGALALGLDRMTGTLERAVAELRDAAGGLEEGMLPARAAAEALSEGTGRQQEGLGEIAAASGELSGSIRDSGAGAAALAAASEQTATAIVAMLATIEEITGLADGLTMSVNDTTATTEDVVASIREIDRNVELLERFVVETSEAMAHMEKVLHRIEGNAADSKGISELVAQNAEKGMQAVELTIEAMEGIRGAVGDSGRVIESVGRRGREIGVILNVIQEVTEQTNLLALNAAIIAAQTGEHGRGFAVVAEEIRQLAERTATSAKEIGSLIAAFQSETGQAVAAMQEGSRRVEQGVERSREAGRALKEILESARRSSAMVSDIAAATREQAGASQEVSASVNRVHDMVARIKKSTIGQSLGSEQIKSAVENMREMSGHVKQATVEQSRRSGAITQAIGQVTSNVGALQRLAAGEARASDRIQKTLASFAGETAANRAAAARLREALADLRVRTGALRRDLDRFELSGRLDTSGGVPI